MGVMNPTAVMKNIIPVIMAGVLGIYGLIVSVILIQSVMRMFPVRHRFVEMKEAAIHH